MVWQGFGMSVGRSGKQECPHPLKMSVPVYLFLYLYWFLDLKQSMNHPLMCLMASDPEKTYLCT